VFPLAAQLAWVLWAHPGARRPALIATGLAAIAFLPWLQGFRIDADSGTTDILSALQPFTPSFVRTSLAHWLIGYPFGIEGTGMRDIPGVPALLLLAAALLLGLAGVARHLLRDRPPLDPRIVLVVALALSAPVGEALASLVGSNLFGTRNLAGSWPALALCLSALVLAAGPRLRYAAAALAVAAFAIAGVKMLTPDFGRADFHAVVAEIERASEPGDVVVDAAPISPAGLPTPLDVTLGGARPLVGVARDDVRYDPFRIVAVAPPPAEVVREAARQAAGHRLFIVFPEDNPLGPRTLEGLPPGWREVERHTYRGAHRLVLVVAEDQTASGA
jgi:hypothetical protein